MEAGLSAHDWQDLFQWGDDASGRLIEMLQELDAQVQEGGGGSVNVITVPISSSDLKQTSPWAVPLVAGQAGKLIVCLGGTLYYEAGNTPYTDPGAELFVATGIPTKCLKWFTPTIAGWLDQPTDVGYAQAYGNVSSSFDTDYEGGDLFFGNDAFALTDGDGTVLVSVIYAITELA